MLSRRELFAALGIAPVAALALKEKTTDLGTLSWQPSRGMSEEMLFNVFLETDRGTTVVRAPLRDGKIVVEPQILLNQGLIRNVKVTSSDGPYGSVCLADCDVYLSPTGKESITILL